MQSHSIRFEAKEGADGLAAKGALHAKIKCSNSTHIHIFATHLQASYTLTPTVSCMAVRHAQMEEVAAFVELHSDGYPALLAGDFNIDSMLPEVGEYNRLQRLLEARGFKDLIPKPGGRALFPTSLPYTWHGDSGEEVVLGSYFDYASQKAQPPLFQQVQTE